MYEITDVQVILDPEPTRPEVRAHASFVVAGLCVRDIRIVRGGNGRVRVVFPNMPVFLPCATCGWRVAITHRYCHGCGVRQPFRTLPVSGKGVVHKYNSVCFPTTSAARAEYEAAILHAYCDATNARAKAS